MASGPTYYPIATYTTTSTQSSYTFTSIPQTYTDLVLVMNVVPNGSGSGTFIVNSDTTSSYGYTAFVGLNTTGYPVTFYGANQSSGTWCSSGAALTNSSNLHLDIFNFMNYSNTSMYKTIIHRENTSQFGYIGAWANVYRNTAAITSITMQLSSSFGIGTTFTLYGIKGA